MLATVLRIAAVAGAVLGAGASAVMLATGHASLWWWEFAYFPTT